jgi:hypothetical protein
MLQSRGVTYWMTKDGSMKMITTISDLELIEAIQHIESAMVGSSEHYDSIVNLCSENHPKYNDLLLEAIQRRIINVSFVMRRDGTIRYSKEWTQAPMEFTIPKSDPTMVKRKINIE